jgi:hypothetical protein
MLLQHRRNGSLVLAEFNDGPTFNGLDGIGGPFTIFQGEYHVQLAASGPRGCWSHSESMSPTLLLKRYMPVIGKISWTDAIKRNGHLPDLKRQTFGGFEHE